MNDSFHQRYAEIYDAWVPDWPGEIEFYKEMAKAAQSRGERVLELGCGTGRVAVRLAQDGVTVTGLDLSEDMLSEARAKSRELSNMRWVQGDIRNFEMGDLYGLIIIPGHAFMNVLTFDGQLSCLRCIRRHLNPHGVLVVHVDYQDFEFLAKASGAGAGLFGQGQKLVNPKTGLPVLLYKAWTYERSTQIAYERIAWEYISTDGQVLNRWESDPIPVHCLFRFEMEHLLARAEFKANALYGDFHRHELRDNSSEMIWVATPC